MEGSCPSCSDQWLHLWILIRHLCSSFDWQFLQIKFPLNEIANYGSYFMLHTAKGSTGFLPLDDISNNSPVRLACFSLNVSSDTGG